MTDTTPETEPLKLRARPRPVKRLSRKAVGVTIGTMGLLLLGATMLAIRPPQLTSSQEELYSVTRKPVAEGLRTLPGSYADLPPPRPVPVPELGPPLPGDLGEALLEAERSSGMHHDPLYGGQSYGPDGDHAERMREVQQERQAREAGVFFSLSHKGAGTADSMSATERAPAATGVSSHRLQDPTSPYEVKAGTVIPAALITGLNSDLPGTVLAQVTEPVYDSVTGRHLLIPQGARLIGDYESTVAFGQERAFVVWRRLLLPDGSSLTLDDLPAADVTGAAGLRDRVDLHEGRLMKGIALATVLGVGAELTVSDAETGLERAVRESIQGNVNQTGQKIVDRHLNVKPTIRIRPGWPLRVIVTRDLVMAPYGTEGH
ncbi:MAG: TrbI/VirB10 family protein [Sphingomonadales bacterium]|nr:TrbI/VirB10 family protein [Sphingomonadales bacterium]